MNSDESSIMSERSGSDEQNILEGLLLKLIQALEKGRDDIYLLAEASNTKIRRLQLEMENIDLDYTRVMEQLQEKQQNENVATQVLSEAIPSWAIDGIEESNTEGLLDLIKQQQIQMQRKRDEILQQLQNLKTTYRHAYEYLNTTHLALQVLQGQLNIFDQPQVDASKGKQAALWLLKSQEIERRKIARELHDGQAQTLAAVLMLLDYLQRLGDKDLHSMDHTLGLIKAMSRESLDEIRRVIFDLKPAQLEEGFYHTLEAYLRDIQLKYNLQIEVSLIGVKRKYDPALSASILRIVQEAISNIRKHAATEKAMLRLEDDGQKLTLIIKDQGIGFDPQQQGAQESFGILGMKERVQLLGGVIQINSQPGAGTHILIIVPLEGEENNE